MEQLSLLAIIAHPGDELAVAGTLARHAASGVRVSLLCATGVEALDAVFSGENHPSPSPLPSRGEGKGGTVGWHALRCSAAHLGIAEVRSLTLRRGMLLQAAARDVVRAIVHQIRALRPQVVLTHVSEPDGGDPEHAALGSLAIQACGAAGDRHQFPLEPGEALHDPDRVYHFGLPEGLLQAARSAGPAMPDEALPVREDVNQFLAAKLDAARCYGNAIEEPLASLLRLPQKERAHLLGTEFLNLALPQPAAADRADPRLFAGLP